MLISHFHQIIPSEVFGMSRSSIYCFWCCPIMSNSFQPHGLGPPGSSVGFSRQEHWSGFISFSGGASPPRDRNPISCVSCIGRQILHQQVPPGKPFIVSAASQLFLVCVCVCLNCGLYSIEWNLQESQEPTLGMLITRMWTFPSRPSHLMRWAPSSPRLIPASCYCYCSLSSLTLRNFLHSNKCSNTWTLVYCVCVIHLLIIFYLEGPLM